MLCAYIGQYHRRHCGIRKHCCKPGTEDEIAIRRITTVSGKICVKVPCTCDENTQPKTAPATYTGYCGKCKYDNKAAGSGSLASCSETLVRLGPLYAYESAGFHSAAVSLDHVPLAYVSVLRTYVVMIFAWFFQGTRFLTVSCIFAKGEMRCLPHSDGELR